MLSAEKELLLHDMQTWDMQRLTEMYESLLNEDQRCVWIRCCKAHCYSLNWGLPPLYAGVFMPWQACLLPPRVVWSNPNDSYGWRRIISFQGDDYLVEADKEEELIVKLGAVVGVMLCL